MAYSIAWAEGSPPGGSTPADTIDTELQNLKISIRERLEQIIPDWADDDVDPKTLGNARGKVSLAVSLEIPDNTLTDIDWDADELSGVNDEDDMVDLVGDASKLTVPADRDGLYVISFATIFKPDATGKRIVQLRKNATSILIQFTDNNPVAGEDSTLIATVMDQAVATDFYQARVLQNSGGALDLRGANQAGVSHFAAHRVPGS